MAGGLQRFRGGGASSVAKSARPFLAALVETFQPAPHAPGEPRARLKDPWPGDAARAEVLIQNEADLMAALDPEPKDPALAHDHVRRARAQSFAWLRDLRSLGGDAARRTARRAVTAWIETNSRNDAVAWRPDIVGQRLAAWMGAYEFFAASAGPGFRLELMEQTAAQAMWLRRRIDLAPPGPGRFAVLAGLASGAAAIGEVDAYFPGIESALQRAIRDEIGPDGALIGAAPLAQLDALMRLLDVRAASAAVGRVPPEGSADAASAMAAPLAALRFGDGGLAVFDGGEGEPWTIDLALAASGWRGRAPFVLPAAGLARALAGRAVLLAGCAPGAIEFAHGPDRLFVSVGASSDAPQHRFTEPNVSAYSAPMFAAAGRTNVAPVAREADGGATLLTQEWRWPKAGADWRRRVYLAADGADLRGEDAGKAPPGLIVDVVFHLHPSADAIQLDDGGVLVRAGSGQGWRFRADCPATLAAEPYRGRPGQPQAALRIQAPVEADANGRIGLRWAFRMEKPV